MGVYDFLKGPCPACQEEIGANSGDIQIKWFSEPVEDKCFRTFRPGDEFPVKIEDGLHHLGTWTYCCGDGTDLFAEIKNSVFVGFKRLTYDEYLNLGKQE